LVPIPERKRSTTGGLSLQVKKNAPERQISRIYGRNQKPGREVINARDTTTQRRRRHQTGNGGKGGAKPTKEVDAGNTAIQLGTAKRCGHYKPRKTGNCKKERHQSEKKNSPEG